MEKIKILVVEDGKEINQLLCDYLNKQGYETISAMQGLEAVSTFREHKDIALVLLDIMLPYQSGDSVLAKIREKSDVPVIMLSAKDGVQTKIDTIRLGADDYITKPFDLDEVLVRIEAILRRTNKKPETASKILTFKNMKIDCEAKTVTVKDNILELTSKEYAILELLLTYPNKMFSKANLFESIWNEPYFNGDTTLKVHMSNLRNKIRTFDEEEYIETIWGMGYRLKN